jgi:hypothetical protein
MLKVNHQGQVLTDLGFSDTFDMKNVRIYTKIKSITCLQPGISEVI